MKYLFPLAITLVFTFGVFGHPLGNFSINQFSRLDASQDRIIIHHILDLAEIPTLQAYKKADTDFDGALSDTELSAYASTLVPDMVDGMTISVNGHFLSLTSANPFARLLEGDGGLATLRVKFDLAAEWDSTDQVNSVLFENKTYEGRTGWNEIVIARPAGFYIFNSSAFGNGVTDELKAFPDDRISAPLSERSADFSYSAAAPPSGSMPLQDRDGRITRPVQKDRLAQLIATPEITPSIALVAIFAAFGLGAVHAMSPGHGKTVVGAYLVGTRGTPLHAAFLGLTVTITHTIGVFALGVITYFASSFFLPERLMPVLGFASGLLVLYIGITLFRSRLLKIIAAQDGHQRPDSHNANGSEYTHSHGGNTHTHAPPESISRRDLLSLGISGGLLPCPSALVLMLSAISLDRVGYGLILTVIFSIGLASTLTIVGLAFLHLGKLFDRPNISESLIARTVPVISSFVIACLGAVICYNAIA
ncbi:MAG: sulfite exporter TauE/SafE family protein [Pyrinomonadaceae bacterium]